MINKSKLDLIKVNPVTLSKNVYTFDEVLKMLPGDNPKKDVKAINLSWGLGEYLTNLDGILMKVDSLKEEVEVFNLLTHVTKSDKKKSWIIVTSDKVKRDVKATGK